MDRVLLAVLVGLFGFASVDKFLHFPDFTNAIDSYSWIPTGVSVEVASLVIASEAAVALGLMTIQWRRQAAWYAFGLLLVFTLGLLGNRLAGDGAVCGCWFSVSMAQGDQHFLFNAVAAAMAAIVALDQSTVRPERVEIAFPGAESQR